MEIVQNMWELLTTLTEESQDAVIKKCDELGFNPDRGEISLNESYINLFQSRDVLKDAIEKKKLIQFPITIQKNILSNLESIISFQSGILSGRDDIINLVNSIEQLHNNIWQFGFYNLTNEVLGYATKLNQLKHQAVKAKELQNELEKGINFKVELENLLNQIKSQFDESTNLVTVTKNNNDLINQNLEKNIDLSQKTSAILMTIQQNESQINQLLSTSKSSNSEITTIESKIKDFYKEIDKHKKEISGIINNANEGIESNKKQTDGLIKQLEIIKDQIKDQLQRATGFTLFHSFQTRQGNINKSKNIWLYALGALIAITIGLTAYIAHSTTNFDIAFYLKLSMSVPLIYAITFVTVQYSRERKLEEEYAFKSNISISLIPYKELIEKLVDSNNPQEREKYTNFIIESINKVFTSPTDKIFDSDGSHHANPEKALKQLGKTIDVIIKPFEPLIKMIKH